MSDDTVALIVCICLIVGLLVSGWAGYVVGVNKEREAATKAGQAEWRIDPKTGEKSFHWLNLERAELEKK